jgi:hypothetical protein
MHNIIRNRHIQCKSPLGSKTHIFIKASLFPKTNFPSTYCSYSRLLEYYSDSLFDIYSRNIYRIFWRQWSMLHTTNKTNKKIKLKCFFGTISKPRTKLWIKKHPFIWMRLFKHITILNFFPVTKVRDFDRFWARFSLFPRFQKYNLVDKRLWY